jgi:3',5'-cyclic-AMP phosphodiesterase
VLRDKPITAILTGHVHNGIATTFAGHPLLVAPGIRSTAPLPFEPAAANGLTEADTPPGLALHIAAEGQPLVTLYRLVPSP